MPKRKFDTLGFLLFGSVVMLSVSLDLFSDKSLSTSIPVTIVLVGFLFLFVYIFHARRTKRNNPIEFI